MAWSGPPITVTPADVREALKAIAAELGLVATCPCGGARWCAGRDLEDDLQQFLQLHAAHRPKR